MLCTPRLPTEAETLAEMRGIFPGRPKRPHPATPCGPRRKRQNYLQRRRAGNCGRGTPSHRPPKPFPPEPHSTGKEKKGSLPTHPCKPGLFSRPGCLRKQDGYQCLDETAVACCSAAMLLLPTTPTSLSIYPPTPTSHRPSAPPGSNLRPQQ